MIIQAHIEFVQFCGVSPLTGFIGRCPLTALDEEIREDSNSPDWQYYKGQQDALRDMRKYISRKIASEAR